MQASVAEVHGLRCSEACGIFPDQGSKLFPELVGGFFTTEPPGKPFFLYSVALLYSLCLFCGFL